MAENDIDEIVEKLMAFPRAIAAQVTMNSKMIEGLITQQERLVEIICKLHNIDLEKLRKEIML